MEERNYEHLKCIGLWECSVLERRPVVHLCFQLKELFCHYSEHSGQRLILTQTPLKFHIVVEKRGIQEVEGKEAVHPIKLVQ